MKKRKKVPLRMCLSCRVRQEKKVMIRIVETSPGGLAIDLTGKKAGRGTYVCPNQDCRDRLSRKNLSAAFKKNLNEEDVARLKKSLEDSVDFP
ncbi:MAG TPA: YlxR family protein [Atribacteraceae bacterium]|nr:YlxR family protein [Atribacteraceae bacterium]